ncbi:hypothetical protein STENM223S_04918 [Streptomyces tendae]
MTAPPILRVEGLDVDIAGSRILTGVTFDVPASGVTALLGRNGVGKTTTIRAVLGLLPDGGRVTAGRVTFAGDDITREPTHRTVRRGIGYAPEDRGVFAGLTVAENLALAERPGHEHRYDLVHDLFPELAARRGQRAGTLSGGQQQMVALARTLLNDNSLVVVDEPTKGLAPRVVTEAAEVLERAAERVPLLLVEQNLAVVRRLARSAVVLDAGRVITMLILGSLFVLAVYRPPAASPPSAKETHMTTSGSSLTRELTAPVQGRPARRHPLAGRRAARRRPAQHHCQLARLRRPGRRPARRRPVAPRPAGPGRERGAAGTVRAGRARRGRRGAAGPCGARARGAGGPLDGSVRRRAGRRTAPGPLPARGPGRRRAGLPAARGHRHRRAAHSGDRPGDGPAVDDVRQYGGLLAFFRAHPALGPHWGPHVTGYVTRDLTGRAPELRSSCVLDAVRADGADVLGDAETLAAVHQPRVRGELLWAERGLLDEPRALYDAERVAAAALDPVRMPARRIDGTNHSSVLFPPAVEEVASAVRGALAGG